MSKYLTTVDDKLTIRDGIRLINQAQASENKAWQWMLRNRWNVGVIGLHLNVVYGEGTIDTYADELEMSITTVRECISAVKYVRLAVYRFNRNEHGPKYDSPEAYYEEMITTPDDKGRPKRWYHIQQMIRSNIEPGALTGVQLARRLIAVMEENNRTLEAVNNVAQSLPEPDRSEMQAEIRGVEAAYTEEAERFVRGGHKVIKTDALPEMVYSEKGGVYYLHKVDEPPEQGTPLRKAESPVQALIHGMKSLGYHVSKIPDSK